MELFIHKYLSQYYYLKTSDVGNDGIYYHHDDRVIPVPYTPIKLVVEIVNIFGLEEDAVRETITNWAISINPSVDLEFYWKIVEFDSIMPIAMRVASQTIGMDLVSVQPMLAPLGELMYLDFNTGGTPNRNGRVYNQEVMSDVIMELHNRQLEISIEDRDDSLVSKALRKWSDFVGVSSRQMDC